MLIRSTCIKEGCMTGKHQAKHGSILDDRNGFLLLRVLTKLH